MSFTSMFLFVAAFLQTTPETKVFTDQQNTVTLAQYEDGIIEPIIRTKEAGDAAIVEVFYHQTLQMNGKPVELLRAKTAICPLLPHVDCGCDFITGLRLSDVAWVKVKFFRTLKETEIGREEKPKR